MRLLALLLLLALPVQAAPFGSPMLLAASTSLPPTIDDSFLTALPADWTFTRASNGWYFNSAGVLTLAETNAPRFDYDPGTHAGKGLLLEEARTNVFLNSQSPATQNITTSAVAYTVSFYGTGSIALTGTHTHTLAGTGANDLVQYTFTPTAGTLTCTVSGTITNAQVEAGAFATSRIVTAAAPVVREKDILYTTSLTWFNATEGTIVLEYTPEGFRAGFEMYAGAFSDGGSSNQIAFYVYPAAVKADVAVSGAHKSSGTSSAMVAGNTYKTGIVYKNGANLISHNGVALTDGTFAGSAVPTVTRLTLMNYGDTGRPLSGHLRSVKYWNTALTAAKLNGATQ